MVSTKNITIAVVAILVVAGVGAFLVLGDGDEGVKNPYDTSRLQIFGNANNDDKIDQDDITFLETLKTDWNQEKYPFADANRDGKITDADIEIVNKIINKEDVGIYYVDGNDLVKNISLPINRIVLAGTTIHPIIAALDVADKAVAKTGKSTTPDPVLCVQTVNLYEVSTIAYQIDIEKLSNVENVDAVLTLNTTTYTNIEEALEPTGISCIRIDPETGDKTIRAYLLLGVLLDCEERSRELIEFYDTVTEFINEKVAQIPQSERKKTLSLYSYSIGGANYYISKNTEAAGGINLTEFPENSKSIKENPDWALIYNDAEYLFEYTSWKWRILDDLKDESERYGMYYTLFDAYPVNYVCINKDLPDIVRIAYVASILYPDVFGEDYGTITHQAFVDQFYSFLGDYDVTTKGTWVITYDMFQP